MNGKVASNTYVITFKVRFNVKGRTGAEAVRRGERIMRNDWYLGNQPGIRAWVGENGEEGPVLALPSRKRR